MSDFKEKPMSLFGTLASPGVGWRNANYGFIMGKKDAGGSIGHLVNGLVLTQSNLVKLQELLNIINIEESVE